MDAANIDRLAAVSLECKISQIVVKIEKETAAFITDFLVLNQIARIEKISNLVAPTKSLKHSDFVALANACGLPKHVESFKKGFIEYYNEQGINLE